ncbi:MAG: hypothetical protein WCA32_17385 [Chromatiaceae bacterium]
MDWGAYDYYVFASAALLGTIAAAAGLLWALRRERWRTQAESLAGVAAPFINVVGVLFGLTLAFLANDTWNAHDRALAAVDREADALRSITILAGHLPAADADRARNAVQLYARAAVEEWPMLARRQTSSDAARTADDLLDVLAASRIATTGGPSVSQAAIALALAVRDGRQTRLALSQTHVNPLKWAGMAFLGFLTMLSVALVHVGSLRPLVASVTIFALASAPTAVIVLIHGNPFQPPAAVSPAPLVKLMAIGGRPPPEPNE